MEIYTQKYLKKKSRQKYPSFARCMVTCENFASWFRNLESTFARWNPSFQVAKSLSHVGLHRECTTAIHFKFRTLEFQFRKVRNCPLADAVVFWRPYLSHFSSKSYTVWSIGFLTSWALKWYIECRKWTSGSAPKVRKKTAAAVLCFLYFLFASLLCLACLNDPKSCQHNKTSHKYD